MGEVHTENKVLLDRIRSKEQIITEYEQDN